MNMSPSELGCPPISPKFPAAERDLAVENPAAGNGIFGCRDERLKIGLRDRKGSPETERAERYPRKSPQKRPIRSRRMDLRFRKTGWWRHSGTNWRPTTQSSNRS